MVSCRGMHTFHGSKLNISASQGDEKRLYGPRRETCILGDGLAFPYMVAAIAMEL